MRPRRPWIVACAALLLLVPPATAQQVANPELFAKTVSASEQALAHYGRMDDDDALRRVADIGYRLAGHSGFDKYPFTFHLVEMREPNAFALPGGQVFLTRGMLELGLDDDQLAGLLGHEIAHVTLEHGLKMQRRATLLNVLSQAVLVGVILAGDSGSDRSPPGVPRGRDSDDYGASTVQGAAAASVILGELLLRNYSREFEDQADEEGQRLAAAAGFAPIGAAELFTLMAARLPQSREYGYWRTHPFFTERIGAARARGEQLKAQEPRPVEAFRASTQSTLLAFEVDSHLEEERREPARRLLEDAALVAWPKGETAERLRLESLERVRDEALDGPEVSRDYGELLRAYEKQRATVAELTPESPFLARLDREIEQIDGEKAAVYPRAVEVFSAAVYQTRFLETFLSNFPAAPEVPGVAVALAGAYARLGRQTEAVERYLQAWEAEPGSELGERALRGLRSLASSVDRLSALEQLTESEDRELAALGRARLEQMAGLYSELENGADYLRRFPDGAYAEQVATRLDRLAEQLYGEIILYRGVGDSIKALDRAQQILTHAPTSPAADRLREEAVVAEG